MTLSALALAVILSAIAGAPALARVPPEDLARDVAGVVESEGGIPELGRRATVRMLLAISFHESGWRTDVDSGAKRGQGIDLCLMQVRPVNGFVDQWTIAELLADRRRCIAIGLKRARRSIAKCRTHEGAAVPLIDRLAAYASGSCGRARAVSREFFALERKWRGIKPAALPAAAGKEAGT